MRYRCDNPDDKDYKNYGGRGVTYCGEWAEFMPFAEDMGHKPGPEYTLERIDNDGPYCKSNCVWDTRTAQNNNSRNVNLITINGQTKPLNYWCLKFGITRQAVYARVKGGMSIEKAVQHSKHKRKEKSP